MRIKTIYAKNVPPIKLIHVENLSDIVVFAGPNGVGKTRLINWLLSFFQSLPQNQDQWIEVEATSATERADWGKTILDTRQQDDVTKLRTTLQKNRRRAQHESSLLNFESDRTITQVSPYQFSWDYQDPFEELIGWNFGFNSLTNRFQDTIHSIFRKIRSRREAMALKVEELIKQRKTSVNSNHFDKPSGAQQNPKGETVELSVSEFPDPLVPFMEAFSQLLSPKTLVPPEIKNQQLFFRDGDKQYPLTSLSSGEREVVNVVFDFLLRNPKDCVVVFDEPELHLHPELSYKLLQTLRSSGSRNQFIFCTHSADIISASLDNSVIFISPPKTPSDNQAIVVSEDDETHQALKLMGQSIGIISLGRRIVLIEGDHGSLDKQTYGAILKARFSNLVLVPSGGKGLIQSFSSLVDRVLQKSVWGVEFFMLCDRDAVPATTMIREVEVAAHGRVRVLDRYHLENYFLDERIIAAMFSDWEPSDSWLVSPKEVRERLKSIARDCLSYSAALIVSAYFREQVGNLNIMPSACHGKSSNELTELFLAAAAKEGLRISAAINPQEIASYIKETVSILENSLSSDKDEWKKLIPGRVILKIFCSSQHANVDFGRFKIAYLKAAEKQDFSSFLEIERIFESFSNFGSV